MLISRANVIEQNKPLIPMFVKNVEPGDDAYIFDHRVGSKITVNPDNQETEYIQVRFLLNMAIVVSKNLSSDADLRSYLNGILGGVTLTALGVNPTVMMEPVTDLLGASGRIIEKVQKTETAGDVFSLYVPIAEHPVPPGIEPWTIELTGTVTGFTRTTDDMAHEKADIKFKSILNQVSGPFKETTNHGTKEKIDIQSPSQVRVTVTPPSMMASLYLSYDLETDGYYWMGSSSLLFVREVIMDFRVLPAIH